jgi:hypothetical protein
MGLKESADFLRECKELQNMPVNRSSCSTTDTSSLNVFLTLFLAIRISLDSIS